VRGGLVVCQLSLTLVAIIGGGLFIKSFRNARAAEPGFEPEQVLVAAIDLSEGRYPVEQGRTELRRLRDRLQSLSGVRNASLSEDIPLSISGGAWEEIDVNGYVPRASENMKLWRNLVSPGYFDTIGIPLLAGRDFSERDDQQSQQVAIVNQTFANRFLGGGFALGRKFRAWGKEITIVGVARDSKYRLITEPPLPYFYVPLAQHYSPNLDVAVEVRTKGRPEAFAEVLRSEIRSVDPNVPVTAIVPLVSFMSGAYFAQKAGASLLTVLGLLSLLIAMLGMYGVMAYSISQRTQEIGIRVAVGARPAQVLNLVLREGMRLCLAGTVAGLLLALSLSRLAGGLLYGVGSTDVATYAVAASILIAFALLATWLPARRASRIEPMEALRWE
jgi:predicted permease